MSVMSDGEIMKAITTGEIVFDPPIEMDRQIQPASVDLRLSNSFAKFRPRGDVVMDTPFGKTVIQTDPPRVQSRIIPGETDIEPFTERFDADEIEFHPGQFILGSTIESVKLSSDIVARVEGRSSFGRLGVTVHSTAGFIDPGFEGQITLEMTNEGVYPIVLQAGWRICQLAFERLGKPALKPYGAKRNSKYQGQMGATPSRARLDQEER